MTPKEKALMVCLADDSPDGTLRITFQDVDPSRDFLHRAGG